MKAWRLEVIDGWQIVVHRARWQQMGSIRDFAADHGFAVVDARWRRSDRILMVISFLLFTIGGHWSLLVVGLWAGSDWARSYPRSD